MALRCRWCVSAPSQGRLEGQASAVPRAGFTAAARRSASWRRRARGPAPAAFRKRPGWSCSSRSRWPAGGATRHARRGIAASQASKRWPICSAVLNSISLPTSDPTTLSKP